MDPSSNPSSPAQLPPRKHMQPMPPEGRIEDTALEEELLTHGDYPSDIREVTPIEEEDAEDLIDYLMSNSPEDLQP